MDNASKALIMAGAILIAVALVGVGVYLYQSAVGTVGTGVDALQAADMETKNSAIEQYEGDSVSGSDIKQLVRRINAYNTNNVFPTAITVKGDSDVSGSGPSDYKYKGSNSSRKSVKIDYSNGWVSIVTIGKPVEEPATGGGEG